MANSNNQANSKPPNAAGLKPRGGARQGAGRKPKAIKELEKQLIDRATMPPGQDTAYGQVPKPPAPDADATTYAMSFLDFVQRNPIFAEKVRLDAAKTILDRVLGKARQQQEVNHNGDVRISVEFVDRPPCLSDEPSSAADESDA